MKTKIILLIANLVLMSCSVMNNKKTENIKYRDLDLSAILDKNQLYVNLSLLNDKDFECTEEEKQVTKDFYRLKD